MRPLENPSITRIITGYVLSLVGATALTVASFHALETIAFFWPADRLRLLRLVLIFGVGAILVASGALLFHDNVWGRAFVRGLPLSNAGLAGVGLMNHVAHLYLDRSPKEDLVFKLFDYRFELSGDLHKGVQVIRIETPGPSMHEVDIYRLHESKSVADLNSWRKQQGHGAAPAEALGGALDSHDISRVVWLRKKFTPGHYVLHCEMPVTNTELTHADVGMVREIEIKE
jgi:hypothetical protein